MDVVFNLPDFIESEVPPVTIKVLKSRPKKDDFELVPWSHITMQIVKDPVCPDVIFEITKTEIEPISHKLKDGYYLKDGFPVKIEETGSRELNLGEDS